MIVAFDASYFSMIGFVERASGAPAFLPAIAGENAGAPPRQSVVEASKANNAKRKASTTKVITNADVKKSKGKLIAQPAAAASTAVPTDEKKPVSLAEHDARYKVRVAAAEKVTISEKKVATLEKDLEAIEQRYYEENDPTYRDTVIQKRFAQAKRQLEDARRELADARDVLQQAQVLHP